MEGRYRLRHERTRHTTKVGTESRTKQSFKKDCDINEIMKRHSKTGLWDHLAKREPTYGDFSHAQDLKSAMDQVMAAQSDFDALPAEVRNLCDNDPERLLRALASREETAALFDAGLPMAENYEPWREDDQVQEMDQGEESPEEKPKEKAPSIEGGE